ncbi:MAG: hypothetical protein ABW168_05060 [Sedimenticola sp.]
MHIKYEKRNSEIATRILLGESPSKIAQEYGLSISRCSQILHTYCFRIDRDVYGSISNHPECKPKLKELQEYADVFLDDNYGESITLYSPIWRVKGASKKIIYVLECEEICTVGELLKTNLDMLIRSPYIGPVILEEIKNIAERYKHLLAEDGKSGTPINGLTKDDGGPDHHC